MVRVNLPVLSETSASSALDVEEMDIDLSSGHPLPKTFWSPGQLKESDFPISSDGLLLYVGEAAYESGESPLSVWVPRLQYEGSVHNEQAADGGQYHRSVCVTESPLDTFERSGLFILLFPIGLTQTVGFKAGAPSADIKEKWNKDGRIECKM